MVVFRAVQFQGTGNGIQDTVRNAAEVPAFQPGVIVHADARQPGHLLAAQPRYAPPAAVRFNAGLLRGDAPTAGGQELSDLGSVIHGDHVTTIGIALRRFCQNQLQQGPR
ncbi:hypothetical protein NicSoilB11_34740 [Arthrobacter sp. NicSoilB11]|nr:hypothetical protein StoSoilB19_34260 [Arthrobacter sp. StoSoilB19]BCW77149.1 hypothetical protein NicSoilB11_34740 [Arthrobacter sp. NicSoilB11]